MSCLRRSSFSKIKKGLLNQCVNFNGVYPKQYFDILFSKREVAIDWIQTMFTIKKEMTYVRDAVFSSTLLHKSFYFFVCKIAIKIHHVLVDVFNNLKK